MTEQPVDPLGKVTEQKDFLGRIRSFVSSFSGYVERDQRREADKVLRETIAERYEEQWARISDIQRRLVSSGRLKEVGELERAALRLRTLIDRVRGASYGYAGLFDHLRIGESELAELYSFDLELLQANQRLTEGVNQVEAAIGSDELPDRIHALQALTQGAIDTYNRRDELITTA